jgi:SAM-dependent methyltransferase
MLDSQATREYLLSFDIFAGAPQERINYLADALYRFLVTLEMVPDKDMPGLHLLELGAGPYFFTLLLQKYTRYTLHQANFFGHNYPGPMAQTVTSARYGEQYTYSFANFNGETEPFPYDDGRFDLVTFCEIIEHLTVDPTHMLCEIHRILKPGGALLLTTPNVFRLEHVLALAGGRHNIFHPYSGYGVYGRHQREYGMGELLDLVKGCGYEVVTARFDDILPCPGWHRLIKRVLPQRHDHLFVLARATRPRRYYYPPYLYISTHAISRVVSNDIIMGDNDVGHLGLGWWPPEPFRWTSELQAVARLRRPAQASTLSVEANASSTTLGPVEVTLRAAGQFRTFHLQGDDWQRLELELPASNERTVEVQITVDRLRPDPASGGRNLGVMVRRLTVA